MTYMSKVTAIKVEGLELGLQYEFPLYKIIKEQARMVPDIYRCGKEKESPRGPRSPILRTVVKCTNCSMIFKRSYVL